MPARTDTDYVGKRSVSCVALGVLISVRNCAYPGDYRRTRDYGQRFRG
jgi:hypothetical protein